MADFAMAEMHKADAYKLLTRLVAPRPIALVSTLGPGGGNLAPFSFFVLGGASPPSCAICPTNDRHGQPKDTLRNIEANGEYVISVCTRDMAERINQASYPYAYGDDEFDHAGLTRRPSRLVAPPGVAESPAQLECRLYQLVRHGDGPLASSWVIGEIVHVSVRDDLLIDGMPDQTRIEFLGRLGGNFYTTVTPASQFELARPTRPAGSR
jgi:flavin reductase (DIM6/NTAB) family NADH-FMN oxidoreductase RutF